MNFVIIVIGKSLAQVANESLGEVHFQLEVVLDLFFIPFIHLIKLHMWW